MATTFTPTGVDRSPGTPLPLPPSMRPQSTWPGGAVSTECHRAKALTQRTAVTPGRACSTRSTQAWSLPARKAQPGFPLPEASSSSFSPSSGQLAHVGLSGSPGPWVTSVCRAPALELLSKACVFLSPPPAASCGVSCGRPPPVITGRQGTQALESGSWLHISVPLLMTWATRVSHFRSRSSVLALIAVRTTHGLGGGDHRETRWAHTSPAQRATGPRPRGGPLSSLQSTDAPFAAAAPCFLPLDHLVGRDVGDSRTAGVNRPEDRHRSLLTSTKHAW